MVELNNNMVIHVNNKEENEKFLKMCEDLGVEEVQDYYNIYGKYTCYHIEDFHLYYCDVSFFIEEGIKIIEFKDLKQ